MTVASLIIEMHEIPKGDQSHCFMSLSLKVKHNGKNEELEAGDSLLEK